MEDAAQNYLKFLLGAALGCLFLWIGVTGRLGSFLGAFVTPGYMAEGNVSGGTETSDPTAKSTGPGQTLDMTAIGALAYNAGVTSVNALAIAIAVAQAESQGKTSAHNPGNGSTDIEDSYGLWQINVLAHPNFDKSRLYQGSYNATAMFIISNGGMSWGPWGTYTSGEYRKYINQALITAQMVLANNAGK